MEDTGWCGAGLYWAATSSGAGPARSAEIAMPRLTPEQRRAGAKSHSVIAIYGSPLNYGCRADEAYHWGMSRVHLQCRKYRTGRSPAADILLRRDPDEPDEEEEEEEDNGEEEDNDDDDGYSEWACLIYFAGWRMKREHFVRVVEKALDSLPEEFCSRIRNVAVLVEDMPPNQPSSQSAEQRQLLLGLFHGVPVTKKSIFGLRMGPDYIVLYQKNIEAVCSSKAEVCEQIRLTVIHELATISGWMIVKRLVSSNLRTVSNERPARSGDNANVTSVL
jgi:predicted Zn-dependent protease with MMP-like domain